MVNRIRSYFRGVVRLLRDLGLLRLLGVGLALLFLGAIGLWMTEPRVDAGNALWWSIVTLTTVGYGDISPATPAGRVIGTLLMIFGIGVIGAFTGQVASLLTERRRLRDKGLLVDSTLSDHIIFSGWSDRAKAVLQTIRSDERGADRPIVLIDEREEVPVRDEHLIFVQGKTEESTLRKANLEGAETVICFADPSLDEEARDAKVVLHLLTVESLNPSVHTIAEVERASSIEHCRRANADEVIVGNEFTSHLMSRASIDHGISNVLSELMDPRTGVEIFKVPASEGLIGAPFASALQQVKEESDCIVVGVETIVDGQQAVLTNPDLDREVKSGDSLILIGKQEAHRLKTNRP